MASLLSIHKLGKWQGSRKLFENISFGIETRSKVALIGPNGAGKSTLLNILAGKLDADDGSVTQSKDCRIAFLEQNPTFQQDISLLESILEPVPTLVGIHDEFYYEQQAYKLISSLGFEEADIPYDAPISSLSGGWRKKAALARELLKEPSLLLMDEPTNHLDVESILWLENFLQKANFATLTVTHDRSFLQNTSSVIVELNKCYSQGFLKITGDYSHYCEVKADIISANQQSEKSMSNRLRREMEWMRKSPKARATKQTARIKQTEELQEIVGQMSYRSRETPVKIEFKNHELSPKKLIEAEQISKSFADNIIFENFDLFVAKNSRIGLIGANGSGKSTLINCLLGREPIDSGKLKNSERLQLNYFQQSKELDSQDVKLIDYFVPGGGNVNFCGQWVSTFTYLARFAFTPEQHATSIKNLSGGEKSRLLLAQLMLQESNLLVLDEPTNDLDLDTLNILEEQLSQYQGALILVSHDRYFLDQVCNEFYAFSPNPNVHELTSFADVHQWERWHAEQLKNMKNKAVSEKSTHSKASSSIPPSIEKKPLSNKEKYELASIETNLPKKEQQLAKLTEDLQNSSQFSPLELQKISRDLASLQKEVDLLYSRWNDLS